MEENKTMHCINCTVTNCIHHTAQDRCDAGEIKVCGEFADSDQQTCCETFRLKEYC